MHVFKFQHLLKDADDAEAEIEKLLDGKLSKYKVRYVVVRWGANFFRNSHLISPSQLKVPPTCVSSFLREPCVRLARIALLQYYTLPYSCSSRHMCSYNQEDLIMRNEKLQQKDVEIEHLHHEMAKLKDKTAGITCSEPS